MQVDVRAEISDKYVLRTAERRDDIQSTETRGFYTGGIEPQDTCKAIQVQYNRQTQESIIDMDVVEWEQAEMAKCGGVVVVCVHNGNVDLTLSFSTSHLLLGFVSYPLPFHSSSKSIFYHTQQKCCYAFSLTRGT
jgi:hypothetical protein